MGIGAIGVDHPDLIAVADVPLVHNPSIRGPGETVHAVKAAGSNLHGGVGITGRTDPEIDVYVHLDSQERAGIRGYAERGVTVHVTSELARFLATFCIPIDLLRNAGFLLGREEDAALIG